MRGFTGAVTAQLTSPSCSEEIFTLRLPVWPMFAAVISPRPLWMAVRQPFGLPSVCSSKEGLEMRFAGESVAACVVAGL